MATKRKTLEDFIQSLKKNAKIHCQSGCKFDDSEIEALGEYFKALTITSGPNVEKMDRPKFRDEFLQTRMGITDDFIMDRIFRAFDRDSDSYINKEEWVIGLNVLMKGDLEDRIKYCFSVYDLNSDGFISREEMFHLLKPSLIKVSDEDPDEGVKDLVELVMKKLDLDHDQRVSPADFKAAVMAEPLMLECLGPCLPSMQVCEKFMRSLRPGGNVMMHGNKHDDDNKSKKNGVMGRSKGRFAVKGQ